MLRFICCGTRVKDTHSGEQQNSNRVMDSQGTTFRQAIREGAQTTSLRSPSGNFISPNSQSRSLFYRHQAPLQSEARNQILENASPPQAPVGDQTSLEESDSCDLPSRSLFSRPTTNLKPDERIPIPGTIFHTLLNPVSNKEMEEYLSSQARRCQIMAENEDISVT